jgi:acyl dehydratase
MAAELPSTPSWDTIEVGRIVHGERQQLDATTTALQVSGSQDWNLVHHDCDFAVDSGHEGVLYNTGWTAATLARVLTDWVGANGWLAELGIQMRGTNGPGQSIQAMAKVVRKYEEAGDRLLDLEVWIDNDTNGVTTTGTAIVRLP